MTNPVRPVDFSDDAIRCRVTVPVSPATAFERFRHDIARWWPREYTWSGDSLEDMFFEGRKGGALWERGPDGFRCDIARVLRWVPPDRVVLRWHIGPGNVPEPNPVHASEVEVRFFGTGEGTRIELEHRGFFHHGRGAVDYRNLMAERWPEVLGHFADLFAREAPLPPKLREPWELENDPVLKNLSAPV